MEFASFELSKQLRDAGFPQPTFAPGQVWYVKDGQEDGDLGLVYCGVIVLDSYAAGHYVVVNLSNKSYRLPINPFKTQPMAYCPTVEDMLSLLKPEWVLKRTAENNWIVADAATLTPLYLEKTPIAALMEAWVDRRHLFEDAPGQTEVQAGGSVPEISIKCPPMPTDGAMLDMVLYDLARKLTENNIVTTKEMPMVLDFCPLVATVNTGVIQRGGHTFKMRFFGNHSKDEWVYSPYDQRCSVVFAFGDK